MNTEYISPDSPNAFVDFPPRKRPPKGKKRCPKCKGYGGWNLKLNQYNLDKTRQQEIRDSFKNFQGYINLPLLKHDMPDWVLRHYYVHFCASCDQCHGTGAVYPNDVNCIHDFSITETIANCVHRDTCSKCGKSQLRDSSD